MALAGDHQQSKGVDFKEMQLGHKNGIIGKVTSKYRCTLVAVYQAPIPKRPSARQQSTKSDRIDSKVKKGHTSGLTAKEAGAQIGAAILLPKLCTSHSSY